MLRFSGKCGLGNPPKLYFPCKVKFLSGNKDALDGDDDDSPQFRRSRTSFESEQLETLEKVLVFNGIYWYLMIFNGI